MAGGLVSCGSCARHIRRAEETCPFCGAAVIAEAASAPSRAASGRPTTRAAILLATVAAVAGCGKEPKPPEPDAVDPVTGKDAGMMIVNPYGVPIPQDASPPPQPVDAGRGQMMAPAYGVPPPGGPPKK